MAQEDLQAKELRKQRRKEKEELAQKAADQLNKLIDWETDLKWKEQDGDLVVKLSSKNHEEAAEKLELFLNRFYSLVPELKNNVSADRITWFNEDYPVKKRTYNFSYSCDYSIAMKIADRTFANIDEELKIANLKKLPRLLNELSKQYGCSTIKWDILALGNYKHVEFCCYAQSPDDEIFYQRFTADFPEFAALLSKAKTQRRDRPEETLFSITDNVKDNYKNTTNIITKIESKFNQEKTKNVAVQHVQEIQPPAQDEAQVHEAENNETLAQKAANTLDNISDGDVKWNVSASGIIFIEFVDYDKNDAAKKKSNYLDDLYKKLPQLKEIVVTDFSYCQISPNKFRYCHKASINDLQQIQAISDGVFPGIKNVTGFSGPSMSQKQILLNNHFEKIWCSIKDGTTADKIIALLKEYVKNKSSGNTSSVHSYSRGFLAEVNKIIQAYERNPKESILKLGLEDLKFLISLPNKARTSEAISFLIKFVDKKLAENQPQQIADTQLNLANSSKTTTFST